jgi:hypothetical protein
MTRKERDNATEKRFAGLKARDFADTKRTMNTKILAGVTGT